MKWLKRLLAGLLALLMVAMVAAYLTPLDTYVPEVEQVLSSRLHEPVGIRHIRIAVMPLPHLELQDVRLGGQEGIAVQSVDVALDWPALLAGKVVLSRIVVKDGTAHLALVRKLVDLLANPPAAAQRMAVRELQLSGMSLRTPEMTLGPAEGKLEFTRAGQLERAWFAMDEQKVTATLLPLPPQSGLPANVPKQATHFAVQVQARGWTPPKFQQFPQMPLDELQIEGVLGKQDFVAQKFSVTTRGMRMAGAGKVEFSDGWRVQATLTQAAAPLEQVMALMGEPLGLTGALSVKGELSAKANTLSALKDNFRFAGNILVTTRDMRMAGTGKVEFSDGWRVQATLTQAVAPLEQVMALLGKPLELTGALSVKGELSGKASTLPALKDNFRFSGNILVRNATAHIAAGFQHPLVFEQVSARVVAQPESLELSSLEMKLYGGKLSGTASISRKNILLVAEVTATGIAMKSLVEALTNEVLFTGSMDGEAKLSMRLDMFEQFPKNLQLAGNFHLRDGVLTKVDLLQAASNLGKTDTKGGETRFDDLTGLLNVDENGYHFKKLKIKSGSLNAEGKVDISPALQISGTLDANVKGTAGLVSMPMVVSGTINNPIVRPSGSAMAGAAIGTAILGPGLGTAIGVKVGGFLNKLFGGNGDGKNDDKNSNKGVAPKVPATAPATK